MKKTVLFIWRASSISCTVASYYTSGYYVPTTVSVITAVSVIEAAITWAIVALILGRLASPSTVNVALAHSQPISVLRTAAAHHIVLSGVAAWAGHWLLAATVACCAAGHCACRVASKRFLRRVRIDKKTRVATVDV